ncbi:MAG: single-stranded-DNA-specific exonuclease RecJ, partial [Chloroflexi bacterium]|nr:single-stranded-DNA-specific exonuclease RecJ [Chloroflexota bacterium]
MPLLTDLPAIEWSAPQRIGPDEQAILGADSLLLAQLLWNRGIRTADEADCFLTPQPIESLSDPHLMRGVTDAAARLAQAAANREPVAIYGDYDVDGVSGTALLVHMLRHLGVEPLVHLPDRARDGYGVNCDAVRQLAGAGARVMITVDCGISANTEVGLAAQLGIDTIVTDHHTVPSEMPSALAVLNPHQPGCRFPFKDLAGGGVAFQLARAVLATAFGEAESQRLCTGLATFAALSTVADIVPLTGQNRAIVGLGLAAARSGIWVGLQALAEASGLMLSRLTTQDLSFGVIPRLNAAGRMGDARDALNLLLSKDLASAESAAQRLNDANHRRRELMDEVLVMAEEEAQRTSAGSALVLDGAYPVGLAGLIASRLVDRYAVPCAVIERGEETSRGSVRGVDGVHLVRVLEYCGESLIQFGGHERAAGFSLRSCDIEEFRSAFQTAVRVMRGEQVPARVVRTDGILKLESVGSRLADLLDRLEPTGAGNPRPTFVSRGLLVSSAQETAGG